MLMSEEMKRMVELFNRYDEELKAPGIVRSYIAPNIPEKVLQRLVKHYDNHLAANSVVAYYDDTLFGSAKSGLIVFITNQLGKRCIMPIRIFKRSKR